MTFEMFVNKIVRAVADELGSEYEVTSREVPKNNGLVLTGLMIGKKGSCITPVIYLNSMYESYGTDDGLRDLEEMAKLIVADYRKNQPEAELAYNNLSGSLGYEKIRDKIIFKLINTEKNRELLKQIPNCPFHDLSVVFLLFLEEREEGIRTALIHNEHMDFWNVAIDELYGEAEKNTPRLLPETFTGISEVIRELLGIDGCDDMSVKEMEEYPSQFYILTNRVGIGGAACLLYPGVIGRCADRLESDLLILPSSIHETLLLPDDGMVDVEALKGLVQ
ncbi:MAG: DUF5688 family protein, partial [Clostridium sp.]|nr:DUF5688 family protein [Clostridium sp.]